MGTKALTFRKLTLGPLKYCIENLIPDAAPRSNPVNVGGIAIQRDLYIAGYRQLKSIHIQFKGHHPRTKVRATPALPSRYAQRFALIVNFGIRYLTDEYYYACEHCTGREYIYTAVFYSFENTEVVVIRRYYDWRCHHLLFGFWLREHSKHLVYGIAMTPRARQVLMEQLKRGTLHYAWNDFPDSREVTLRGFHQEIECPAGEIPGHGRRL
jgi:hypothetical protein